MRITQKDQQCTIQSHTIWKALDGQSRRTCTGRGGSRDGLWFLDLCLASCVLWLSKDVWVGLGEVEKMVVAGVVEGCDLHRVGAEGVTDLA